ncbi:hypothetical protein EDB89DRAFT_1908349 [Lactarius sanguifluus]|nr:hypothetical protein EDB89DRAFT_1908349 [Lactarius sanguifluus]
MQIHCRRLAALVLRCSNLVVTSKPPQPHLPPHHPSRPHRLDTAVIYTLMSSCRRHFNMVATSASTQQLSGPHDVAVSSQPLPPPRPHRHDHYHYLNCHPAATTSTASTWPRPNTTPSPPVTTSTVLPPTMAMSTSTPTPPRQAHDGAMPSWLLLPRLRHTAAAPTCSPPPLQSATTPPTPPASTTPTGAISTWPPLPRTPAIAYPAPTLPPHAGTPWTGPTMAPLPP